ncbi:Thiamine pyrophosphokinase [Paraliobacillus sp. PM-2]|uniref:thiamine diphosphokinase n=1 Tax=Paraliobacillus sp. PM-2 TaxID=1462524 RepID=UPI00061C1598|nr:thiamine diphosphokinase [Paraliobacillus sp. PM-2]CQR47740.1 Thiamine pyrophosphokinase [Paraliobacillus sp. PM-2]
MVQQIKTVGIVAGGPDKHIANLSKYNQMVDYWIGADHGCITLLDHHLLINLAVGDFDSINEQLFNKVKENAEETIRYPIEKNETDLELAIAYALKLFPDQVFLFGVTGGRMDHTLANVQQLLPIIQQNIKAVIVDKQNAILLFEPGTYSIDLDPDYTNISFIPFSKTVEGLTLEGFYYPLDNHTLSWGSTRCLSNKLLSKKGTFSFDRGILIMIKSRDVLL